MCPKCDINAQEMQKEHVMLFAKELKCLNISLVCLDEQMLGTVFMV